ncbi:MAG: helix-turn-helix domain-containing protein [Candidatus Methanomethyliaceae archaeon]|nr:helix-turn-helix domain-containing protein [Candidatus Methanomethyliaceae archaeon]MDW7971464.1 hypothetical protein [Nitrososphaerota archaeon]
MINMNDENITIFHLLAQYIPVKYRVKFLKELLEIHGSIYKLSKKTKISRPTIYRYLYSDHYPNDSIMAKILEELVEVKRSWTKEELRKLAKDFNELINKL